MGATSIGNSHYFGVSKENKFLILTVDVATDYEQTILDTFEGSNVSVFHAGSLVLNISGASNSSITAEPGYLFNDIFKVANFVNQEGCEILIDDLFLSPWEAIFGDNFAVSIYEYEENPDEPSLFYAWNLSATAEEVRLIFVANGHFNAVVTKNISGYTSWSISGLNNYNFAITKDSQAAGDPVIWTINTEEEVGGGGLVVTAVRNFVTGRIFQISQKLEADNFMEFSFLLKVYPTPISNTEIYRQKNGRFVNALDWFCR